MSQDYEKLGVFYLGREYDVGAKTRSESLLLTDSKDFTTHAVIIGMTGSGKTGLGIGLLEEAVMDQIPVIAIDPKGDLSNIALTFPSLSGADFRPWIDPQQASTAGKSEDAFADELAARWRDGLASWGQDGERIQRLRDAADVTVYTPGSTAGRPLSLLKGFSAPPAALRDDAELFAERVNVTATGLLALLGIDADPITSQEHILLANLLSHFWKQGVDLDLATLIGAIQSPPFSQIGVMPLDSVYPPKDRSALAMRLNNLLAAPGFQAWMQGDPLNSASLLYTEEGKPRISVVSIAHLSDAERMFFVTLLLSDLIGWMRQQPGTGSLRALLYIDELFGYMPPVANPPSKQLLLTLLKQARAFGLGVVLSTQNPVDLDYKGLSNAGMWFIGRLQTERDKARVMDGLAGASGSVPFDRAEMERTISGLGKRVFLMHSVYENAPTVFETRWVMSYLAGPMTRDQLRKLSESGLVSAAPSPNNNERVGAADNSSVAAASASARVSSAVPAGNSASQSAPPVLPPDIPQLWLPTAAPASEISWRPAVLGSALVSWQNSKLNVAEQEERAWVVPLDDDDQLVLQWSAATRESFDVNALAREPQPGASYETVPTIASTAKNYASWTRTLQKFVATNESVTLFQSKTLKLVSQVSETEGVFRARLQLAAREAGDHKLESVRKKYASKIQSAGDKIRRAEQAVEAKTSAASQAKLNTFISVGSAVLGAIFARKKLGAGTVGKISTAARSASRSSTKSGNVDRAEADLEAAMAAHTELEAQISSELELERAVYDALGDELETVELRPKSTDVQVRVVALVWVPYVGGSRAS